MADGDLNAQERINCALCSDMLSTGWLWGLLLMLAWVLGVWLSAVQHSITGVSLGLVLLSMGAYVGMRVALDARLFKRLASVDESSPLWQFSGLDMALRDVLAVKVPVVSRGLSERIRGAMRWYRYLVVLAVATVFYSMVEIWVSASAWRVCSCQ